VITPIRAPKTGLTAETLTITKWHKNEGEFIEKDELLFSIETEKTTLDINASRSGYLIKIIAHAGKIVPVSQVIGLIGDSMNEQVKDARL
jgi:pyruvate/2-oxoglutarate dehydrogenase complex dihydrolipoamide acyltransferase (E2) component